MTVFFLVLGIALLIASANGIWVIPAICIWLCLGVAFAPYILVALLFVGGILLSIFDR